MKIKKLIEAKIKRNYLFVTGTVDIDCKYFINKIEEGITQSNHKNFVTNVKSFMTEWNYFVADPKFLKIIFPMCDFLDQCKTIRSSDKYVLKDAWGLKQSFGHFTREHDHTPAFASGAIFLNTHKQGLYFPEINKTIPAVAGTFILFSGFLKHKNKRNLLHKERYALAFNFNYTT